MNKIKEDQWSKSYLPSKLMAWLFLAVSILMLARVYYRAEVVFLGLQHFEYFKYYIISLAGILFWGLVLRLKGKIRAMIVMVSTSLVAALYLAEGICVFIDLNAHYLTNEKAAIEQNIPFDSRTELEVVLDMRSGGGGMQLLHSGQQPS